MTTENNLFKNHFNNKSVIVTGGSKGVGLGIAQAFLQAGANVFVCGRHQPQHPVSVEDVHGEVRQAQFVAADVRDAEQSQALIDQVIAQCGQLDVLINNAGGSPPVAAADAPAKLTEAIIRLNLIAPMIFAQQAHQAMVSKDSGGSIINIASISGIRPSPGTAAYGAAKAGLINVTRSLAQEWGGDKVRVNAIIAGMIKTEASHEHYGGETGIHLIEASLPMKRMAVPKDIADACLFLASDQASYISGSALEVYGGGEPPSFLQLAQAAVESR